MISLPGLLTTNVCALAAGRLSDICVYVFTPSLGSFLLQLVLPSLWSYSLAR